MPDVRIPSIVIHLLSRMLELYSGNTLIREYPVASGTVEDLFAVVKYGAPVKVTYDRIKVRIDN